MSYVCGQDESVILVIGGMGPMAGIQCYKYILENSKSNGTDQDNLDTVVISYPKRIENRVDFVLGRSQVNPGECVLQFIKPQLQMLSECYKHIYIGVPCVTFHCPPIFSVFLKGLYHSFPHVKVVSIIDSTVDFMNQYCPTIVRIGIMSTEGTRSSKPFKAAVEKLGKSLIYLTDRQQHIVTECIFNTQWGIKSSTFNKTIVYPLFCQVMDALLSEGCEAILLGCTEIPLAIEEKEYKGIPILNPSWIMARALVNAADYHKLAPL